MKKIIWVIVVILLIVFIFPKRMDFVGGIEGKMPSDDKSCVGYSFWRGSADIPDGGSTKYCAGIPISK